MDVKTSVAAPSIMMEGAGEHGKHDLLHKPAHYPDFMSLKAPLVCPDYLSSAHEAVASSAVAAVLKQEVENDEVLARGVFGSHAPHLQPNVSAAGVLPPPPPPLPSEMCVASIAGHPDSSGHVPCQRTCHGEQGLQQPVLRGDPDKPFTCSHCGYKTNIGTQLTSHLLAHSDIQIFPYSVCKCEYTAEPKLEPPQADKANESVIKGFKCDHCEYFCNTKYQLRRHAVIHSEDKPYSCTECDYKCATDYQLLRHSAVHATIKPFACPHCDYRSALKSSLTQHSHVHTGLKPYHCGQCEYRCSKKSCLQRHMMQAHSSARPFNCDQCERKFKTSCDVKRHMKIHFAVKRFSCDQCEYRTARNSDLQRHLRTQHVT